MNRESNDKYEILLKLTHPQLPAMINYRQLCLECDIAELALYYGKCYSLQFCEYLDFNYSREISENIAERINAKKSIFDLFAKHGIEFVKKTVHNQKQYHTYLKNKIQKKIPVIVHLDCYYVPWDPNCKRLHNNHTLLVVGVNNNGYYVSDPYFLEQGWIPFDIFFRGSKFFFEINTDSLLSRDKKPHLNYLKNKIKEMNNMGYYERLLQFSEDLRKAEINEETAEKITLAMSAQELNKQRVLLFMHEWETLENHHCYTSLYSKIWSCWQILKVMSLRAKFRKYDKTSLKKLSDYLMLTRNLEEKILTQIITGELTESKIDANNQLKCVDISKYCNNKGLTESPNNDVANCTGFGEYVCIKDKKTEIEARGYELLVKESMDNILCQGQEIEVPFLEKDIGITLLVTAEWGTYDQEFKFVYSNGVIETETVLIRDWSISDEHRVLIGESYLLVDESIKKIQKRIYADELTISFGENKNLKKIVLPDCSNIHILAIRRNKKGDNND